MFMEKIGTYETSVFFTLYYLQIAFEFLHITQKLSTFSCKNYAFYGALVCLIILKNWMHLIT